MAEVTDKVQAGEEEEEEEEEEKSWRRPTFLFCLFYAILYLRSVHFPFRMRESKHAASSTNLPKAFSGISRSIFNFPSVFGKYFDRNWNSGAELKGGKGW